MVFRAAASAESVAVNSFVPGGIIFSTCVQSHCLVSSTTVLLRQAVKKNTGNKTPEMKINSFNVQKLIDPFNIGAQLYQAFIYVLIAPVNLFNVLYGAFALCTQCGNEQSNTGTDIRAAHGYAA